MTFAMRRKRGLPAREALRLERSLAQELRRQSRRRWTGDTLRSRSTKITNAMWPRMPAVLPCGTNGGDALGDVPHLGSQLVPHASTAPGSKQFRKTARLSIFHNLKWATEPHFAPAAVHIRILLQLCKK